MGYNLTAMVKVGDKAAVAVEGDKNAAAVVKVGNDLAVAVEVGNNAAAAVEMGAEESLLSDMMEGGLRRGEGEK